MKEFWKNPREISAFELKRLKKNIEELGDLSGITHELVSDEIITGNQRVKALNLSDKEPTIVQKFDKPDKQGTVAIGYFDLEDGTKMSYRAVRWTKEQCDKANITANKLGGIWDMDILNNSDLWDKDLLMGFGFDSVHLDPYLSNSGKKSKETAKKTKTTKFFTLQVLFERKEDYLFVTEIIEKSKEKDEAVSDTLKRLLKKSASD